MLGFLFEAAGRRVPSREFGLSAGLAVFVFIGGEALAIEAFLGLQEGNSAGAWMGFSVAAIVLIGSGIFVISMARGRVKDLGLPSLVAGLILWLTGLLVLVALGVAAIPAFGISQYQRALAPIAIFGLLLMIMVLRIGGQRRPNAHGWDPRGPGMETRERREMMEAYWSQFAVVGIPDRSHQVIAAKHVDQQSYKYAHPTTFDNDL